MDLIKLEKAFDDFSKLKNIDFSILYADLYGNSPSSTWGEINSIYSEKSKGIFLKEWFKSKINNEGPKNIESMSKAVIAHRLDENLAKEFYRIFSKYYDISPQEWNNDECFILIEK